MQALARAWFDAIRLAFAALDDVWPGNILIEAAILHASEPITLSRATVLAYGVPPAAPVFDNCGCVLVHVVLRNRLGEVSGTGSQYDRSACPLHGDAIVEALN